MKKNNIGYLLREGVRGVFLHGFMSFAAIWVTVACLLIMGTFGLVLYNLNEMILDLEQDNEVLVYIDDSYSQAEAKSVGSQINMITNVHNARFVSREEALSDFVEEQQDENDRARVSRLLLTPPSDSTDQLIRMAQDCLSSIRRRRLEERIQSIMRSVNTLSGDDKKAAMTEVQALSAKLNRLKSAR